MKKIYESSMVIENDFNLELFITALKSQIDSESFKHCVRQEKDGIKVTVTMHVIEEEYLKRKEEENKYNENLKKCIDMAEKLDPILAFKLLTLER